MENITEEQTADKNKMEALKDMYIMYSDLGIVNFERKDFQNSLKYFKKVLDQYNELYEACIKDKSEETKKFIGHLKNQVEEVRKKVIYLSNLLGDEKGKNDQPAEALEYYENLLIHDPENCVIHCKIAKCLNDMGAYFSAANSLKKAYKLDPQNYDLCKAIGELYYRHIKDYISAINYYTEYVDNSPKSETSAIVCNLIGHLYEEVNQYKTIDKQIEFFERAIEIMPDLKTAYSNLTVVYPRVGRDEDAIKCFQKLFELGATMDNRFDYACLQIKLKNFEEGWKYYEYRFQKENGPTVYPKIKQPKWDGKAIKDKILLVHHEQGYGDSIQFIRYLEQVKPLVKKIVFCVQDELVELFNENLTDIEIIPKSAKLWKVPFDYHIPLMSLMHILQARVDNIPMTNGYLHAIEDKKNKYKAEFFDNDALKIGISWHGSPSGNHKRNVPLEFFYPLTKLNNTKVYSFQKGAGFEQFAFVPEDFEIVDLGSTFDNFSDTAAAMENLDIFITSDNALFNLAGAMGIKTFLLLNKDCEWRWFFDEETTPWYDNVRIFKKQDENESWGAIMHKVMETLSKSNS